MAVRAGSRGLYSAVENVEGVLTVYTDIADDLALRAVDRALLYSLRRAYDFEATVLHAKQEERDALRYRNYLLDLFSDPFLFGPFTVTWPEFLRARGLVD